MPQLTRWGRIWTCVNAVQFWETMNPTACIAWLGIVTSWTPCWSSGESLWRKIPGYLHSSIDALAEANTEEKPGSTRFWPPLLLYVSKRWNRVHVGFMWQISSRAGYIRSTMRVFCGFKNTVVAIIKCIKVHFGQYECGYLLFRCWCLYLQLPLPLRVKREQLPHVFTNQISVPCSGLLLKFIAHAGFVKQPSSCCSGMFTYSSYLCILQDQRLLLFWIFPWSRTVLFFFSNRTGVSGKLKL